jgi:hypothetical protein
VPGADSYTLELCLDAGCAMLVRKITGLRETQWSAELADGALRWRVTAVAPSGLDGYSSSALAFSIAANGLADLAPPVAIAYLVGPGRSATDGVFHLGEGGAIRLLARDDASGLAGLRIRWNDGAWHTSQGEDLTPPREGAEHRLSFAATDRRGRESAEWSVIVRTDREAPASPSATRQGSLNGK